MAMIDTNNNSGVVHSLNPFDPAGEWEDPLSHCDVLGLECPMRIHNIDAEKRMVYDARYLFTWVKKNRRSIMVASPLSPRDLRVVRFTGARTPEEAEEFERRTQAAALLFIRLLLQKREFEHVRRVLRELNVDVLSTGFVGYKRERSYASLLCYMAQKASMTINSMRHFITEIRDLDLVRWNGIVDRTAEAYCTVQLLLKGKRRTVMQELAVQTRTSLLSEIVTHAKLLEDNLRRAGGGGGLDNNNSDDSENENHANTNDAAAWIVGGPMERLSQQVDPEGRNLAVLLIHEACASARQEDSVQTVDLLLRTLRVPCGAFRIPGPEGFWSVSTLYEAIRLHVHINLLAVITELAPPDLLRKRDGDETERPLTVAVRVLNRHAVRYLLRAEVPITNEAFAMAAETDQPELLWLMVHAYSSSSYFNRWKAEAALRHAPQVVEWPEANPPPQERPTDTGGSEHLRTLWLQTALTVAVRSRARHAVAALLKLDLDPTSAWMAAVSTNRLDQTALMRVMRRSLLEALVAHIARQVLVMSAPAAEKLQQQEQEQEQEQEEQQAPVNYRKYQLTTDWQTLAYKDTPLTLAIAHCLDAAKQLAEVVPVRLLNMHVPRTVIVTYVPRTTKPTTTATTATAAATADDDNSLLNGGGKKLRKRPHAVKRTALDLLLIAIKDLDNDDVQQQAPDAMLHRGTMVELQRLLVDRGAMTYDDLVLASPSAPPTKKPRKAAGGAGGAATTKKTKKPRKAAAAAAAAAAVVNKEDDDNAADADDADDDDDDTTIDISSS